MVQSRSAAVGVGSRFTINLWVSGRPGPRSIEMKSKSNLITRGLRRVNYHEIQSPLISAVRVMVAHANSIIQRNPVVVEFLSRPQPESRGNRSRIPTINIDF